MSSASSVSSSVYNSSDFVYWEQLDHENAHKLDLQDLKGITKDVKKTQVAQALLHRGLFRLEALMPPDRKSKAKPTKQMVLDDAGDYIEYLKERNEELEAKLEALLKNKEVDARVKDLEKELGRLQLFHDEVVEAVDKNRIIKFETNKKSK
ncbi:predicted protein [Lichtheimia corymbifera JMRC:FSU:9682]|uniref:Uncharacterized protein n=1 Tax=Lichtheimia corymbifera JMRC:FSU:9682 TaxID=1263082 RepID=A0A068RL81_9FUNG|nr:predicted protein [Lichtheimia corymbifera JMRC:FSU:9682]